MRHVYLKSDATCVRCRRIVLPGERVHLILAGPVTHATDLGGHPAGRPMINKTQLNEFLQHENPDDCTKAR